MAINSSGDIVGISELNPASSKSDATLWPQAAPPAAGPAGPGVDLNCLIPSDAGVHLTWAVGINTSGDIIAEGLTSSNAAEWVLLTPPAGGALRRAFARSRLAGGFFAPCGLNVDPHAYDGTTSDSTSLYPNNAYVEADGAENYYPVAGLNLDAGLTRFLSTGIPQTVSIDGTQVMISPQTCLSGCSDIVVHVTQPTGEPKGTAVGGVTVTASVPEPVVSAPNALLPSGAGNHICGIGGSCGTTATATTDSDGNAVFRYFLPGVVTPLWPQGPGFSDTYVYPYDIITFSVTNTFCGCTSQGPVTLKFFPRLWVNENVAITPGDADGLAAVLSKNAANKKDAETDATNIIKMLTDSKILSNVAIKQLKGLSDLALSEWVDQLMRTTPTLVKLDWFMSKFHLADTGLLDTNLDLSAFGQEIKGPLLDMLSGKFNKVSGILFSKLSKLKLLKLSPLQKQLEKLKDSLNKWFADYSQKLYDQIIGYPFSHDVDQIVNEMIYRGQSKPRSGGVATFKLIDISTCNGQCAEEPLPGALGFGGGSYKLFMLFSEVNKGHTQYSYPGASYETETPISFNPSYWLPHQCKGYGCGPQVKSY